MECEVERLAYVTEKPEAIPPLLHVTFLVRRLAGSLTTPTNEFDSNPISAVEFARLDRLAEYGFTRRFAALAADGFPDPGYAGLKSNIGL